MISYSQPPDFTLDLSKTYQATLETNHGDITVTLDAGRSPNTVNNFVTLARDGFYDGVIFHRVVPGFVIQGGDPTGTGRGGPGYKFRDELDVPGTYARGTVAMANAGPNTNGSQFFICLDDVGLPHAYTIFGEVSAGMDAADAIAAAPRRGEQPVDDCVIQSVTVTET
ncbi:MAG: peptidylprolyl isomerase [Actinomycetota bacterium]|nr:peptidylprolyl isomerase [Actinomycetota bacterium]